MRRKFLLFSHLYNLSLPSYALNSLLCGRRNSAGDKKGKCQEEIGQLKKNNWFCNTEKRTVRIWSTLQRDQIVLQNLFTTKRKAPVKRLSRHKAQSADWTYSTVRLTGLFLCAFSEQVNRASAMRSSIHQYLHLGRATKWTSQERPES